MQHTILQCYIILKKIKSEAALLGWPNPQVNTFPLLCYYHSIRKRNQLILVHIYFKFLIIKC